MKEIRQQQNQNFHICFCQVLEGLVELMEYVYMYRFVIG